MTIRPDRITDDPTTTDSDSIHTEPETDLERLEDGPPGPGRLLASVVESPTLERWAAVALRTSLALVFLWFGALKVTGRSPVFALIAATLPWFNPDIIVPLIGWVEILIGIGLLIPKARPLVLLGLAGHLTGTFLTFITAPSWMFDRHDPLLLTADGEFVLKNLVLISAAIVLLGFTGRRSADE